MKKYIIFLCLIFIFSVGYIVFLYTTKPSTLKQEIHVPMLVIERINKDIPDEDDFQKRVSVIYYDGKAEMYSISKSMGRSDYPITELNEDDYREVLEMLPELENHQAGFGSKDGVIWNFIYYDINGAILFTDDGNISGNKFLCDLARLSGFKLSGDY